MARTLESVVNEPNISLGSLKGWLKASNHKTADSTPASLPSDTTAQHWSAAERLLALNESHALQGAALHAWCREKGLFEQQLKHWREAFCSTAEPNAHQAKAELRELKAKHEHLQRDLRRKDGALLQDICHRHGIAPGQPTVHSDNGSPMKAETMLATMQCLGVAHSRRTAVSIDNP